MKSKNTIISVIGCSGIGKTSYSRKLKDLFEKKGKSATIISLDGYILPKKDRLNNISIYDIRAWDIDSLMIDLEALISNNMTIDAKMYDSSNQLHYTTQNGLKNSDVYILDGVISCNDKIIEKFNPIIHFLNIDLNYVLRIKEITNQIRGYIGEDIYINARMNFDGFKQYLLPKLDTATKVIEIYKDLRFMESLVDVSKCDFCKYDKGSSPLDGFIVCNKCYDVLTELKLTDDRE